MEDKANNAQKPLGLTPVRTMRLIASLVALMGMVFLLLQRVLSAVLVMATDGIKLGLARYNNFTGQFAAQNFAQDKQLLKLLKDVQTILPQAETALTVFLVIATIFIVVALLGFALPKQMVHVLVALKLLKWETGESEDAHSATSLMEAFAKLGEVPLKKLAIPFAVVLAVVVLVFGISNCHEKVKAASTEGAVEEMQQKASAYIAAQKSYFAQKKNVGGAKALQLADSVSTEWFDYKLSGTRFSAVSKVPLGNCPAGSKWSVSAAAKGFFEKELQIYRSAPKDTACAKLSPNFKNIGK
ncbi:MAG: hypothetical protein IKO21_10350 [Fibrobacter sp.]|nr:hypothetical protein [Fibrobacter sp.]